ncbi:MAG: 50S ribosomal protein L24 [Dehalococcoidia bacterium]|nr:50S ribosomal protein L24 [Dehalococcoidia bacterium]
MNIRKGDTVLVIGGKEKGRRGKVEKVLPEENRVTIEGFNLVVRHMRPTGQARQAGRIQKEAPLHMSNVMLVCNKCSRPTRVRSNRLEDGRKVRECQKCRETID